ncbi:hypothetical protein [Ruegeria jejuensis]|uniref:hypothetical protein n=1 Tax=Ruegeria jejuensis TaxID=3233338 RepID=UPI00355B2A9E
MVCSDQRRILAARALRDGWLCPTKQNEKGCQRDTTDKQRHQNLTLEHKKQNNNIILAPLSLEKKIGMRAGREQYLIAVHQFDPGRPSDRAPFGEPMRHLLARIHGEVEPPQVPCAPV